MTRLQVAYLFISCSCLLHSSHGQEATTNIPNDNDARKDTKFYEFKQSEEEDNHFNFKAVNPSQLDSEFDFIIIGAGSAGGVIANRLSEISEWKILLLEVGKQPPSFFVDIPMLAPALQFTDLNWGFLNEKQDNIGLGLVDQRMAYPRGKALGGSSVINFMLSVRGNKEDYNEWERLGNPGWSYNDTLKYFLRSEDAMLAISDEEYHNQGGYLKVQDVPYRTKSADVWVKASEQAGHKYVDYNGKEQLGVSYTQGTIGKGRRWSVEKAYLRPAKDRPNLTILTEASVTKILINSKRKEACGVRYTKGGRNYTAKARKEVIVTAGAFNSPQLLMLSGIGPKEHLEEFNIPVIQDLPVGQVLYDHFAYLGLVFTVNQSITFSTLQLLSPITLLDYFFGKGPLTSIEGAEALTYVKLTKTNVSYPDTELLYLGAGFQLDLGTVFRKAFRITDEVYNKLWAPLVDPEGTDMKVYIAIIREVQRIVSMPEMKKYDAQMVSTPLPGCDEHIFDSDEYWTCAIRTIGASIYHQTSTCKMGPKGDPKAVVDNRLRVYGIKKLRVADTSIFPSPISAHINVPTIMIGEKAADMIKEDWEQPLNQTSS
ncbi:hypothetical protein HHI36_021820 [Cryptolaemus montrouzieri]|uniref:Glucose-methanol-choline oxidoreductase N-terminal domain-containing protein n=1 Tax=Cryptolaemus montrouzieri TaxID=559131 RepID=A0ABD2MYX5_9CUCU